MYSRNTDSIKPSRFHLSDASLAYARALFDVKKHIDFVEAYHQFQASIPGHNECYIYDLDLSRPLCGDIEVAPYLSFFGPDENIIAFISKDDILYREDFASLLSEAGLAPIEGNLNLVLKQYFDLAHKGMPIREAAQTAVEGVLRALNSEKAPLDAQMQIAGFRAGAGKTQSPSNPGLAR